MSPADRRVTPRIFIGSLLFAIGQVAFTMVYAPLAVAAMLVPYRLRYRVVTQWTFLNIWWLARTCRLTHETEGLENIPEQPTVVLSKHQSAWETMVLQRYFAPQAWVLKRELLRIPLFGWGLATLRPIAIDRAAGQAALDQVLEQGAQRLADGIWVVVFPEGTRVAPGQRARYKMGGATLAGALEMPVVPVAHNSGDFWARKSFIKFPGVIRLVIGPPIETAGKTALEINALAEAWIEARVAELREPCDSARRDG